MVKVVVRYEKAKPFLEIVVEQDRFSIIKPDTLIVQLPERVEVRDPDGNSVQPSKHASFWVTVQTIDPYHGVIELPDDWRFSL